MKKRRCQSSDLTCRLDQTQNTACLPGRGLFHTKTPVVFLRLDNTFMCAYLSSLLTCNTLHSSHHSLSASCLVARSSLAHRGVQKEGPSWEGAGQATKFMQLACQASWGCCVRIVRVDVASQEFFLNKAVSVV